ncbi:uncharacterized protein LOC131604804 [Vicia villosa]|uniref:uncharacterized protein LOC131604804 n=1 Tax=Vicia villosa TaxID=3911 RepID=UPI00273B0809|nr:uncharacterized protein LOC131604804 [Vicia villosa]
MLAIEDDEWRLETRYRFETADEEITWVVFRREFMRKYYLEDVWGKKEIEFLELKQANKLVIEYAAKFVKLAKFYPHYSEATAEFSKCIKFEKGLRSEIKKAVEYQKIRVFADLVDSCRIYEEDNNTDYMIVNERIGKHQKNRGKPYDAPARKGKQKVADVKRTSGGDVHAGVVCFKYGKPDHKSTGFSSNGMVRLLVIGPNLVLVLVSESQCQKPKQTQAGGKVFALVGTQTANKDRLIRGTCFINSTHLITIINTGATHCFIAADCVERLGLMLSSINGEIVVDTPAKGSTTTFLLCLKCALSIFDRDFVVDLVCLPLSGMNVILSMNWLKYHHVHINCYDKSVRFSTPEEEGVELCLLNSCDC